jgi:hypothetical protein
MWMSVGLLRALSEALGIMTGSGRAIAADKLEENQVMKCECKCGGKNHGRGSFICN